MHDVFLPSYWPVRKQTESSARTNASDQYDDLRHRAHAAVA